MLNTIKLTLFFLFVRADLPMQLRSIEQLSWDCFQRLALVAMSNGLRPSDLLSEPELVEAAMRGAWGDLGEPALDHIRKAFRDARDARGTIRVERPAREVLARVQEWVHGSPQRIARGSGVNLPEVRDDQDVGDRP